MITSKRPFIGRLDFGVTDTERSVFFFLVLSQQYFSGILGIFVEAL